TWMRVSKTLNRLNREDKLVGLLSFWMSDCALIAGRFAKKHGLKHFCWILGQDAKPGNKYFRWIKPGGHSLIALSDFIVKEVNKNYAVRPAHVIPAGIDTTLFDGLPV